jgi:hypothetical protein
MEGILMGAHADIDHTGLTGIPSAGSVATDAIWDAAGDLAVGTGANTAAKLTKGSDGEVLTMVAGAVDWATPASGGLADQDDFTYLDATEAAAPATPASGFVRIYAKTDGRIYSKDDTGAEYGPFDAAGSGGGPMLQVDDIALDAAGDDFDVDMSGWTTGGSPSVGSVITTEVYDDTCLELTFPSQGDRYYKAIDSGDWTYYLTIYGVTNSTPNSVDALNGMLALCATDNAGTGTGMSLYNDNNAYLWGVASHIYSATGNSIISGWNAVVPAAASNWPIVYRLAKVSTTITAGISFNGGATWLTNTRSDSTTFTRIGIHRLFSSGGTNPKLRVGRFNLVP